MEYDLLVLPAMALVESKDDLSEYSPDEVLANELRLL